MKRAEHTTMYKNNCRVGSKIKGFSPLQQFVFPKGTTFEKEKQRVRTPEVNLLFELTKRTTGIYENKKSGILTHNEMDSALVGLSVLSSNFFSKLLRLNI